MLQLKNVRKVYKTSTEDVEALKDISIEFRESEFVAVLGQSGCGKTTLLNIIGGLDKYTSGDLIIDGKSTKDYKDRDWDSYRNYSVGFVFQSYNLIGHQSVLANVELALTISGYSRKEKRKKAIEALEKVGLGDKIHKKPNQLSGGQMQRVAIARAIVNDPDIILADEPTGALDSKTSVQIMDILKELAKDKLIIMVTHNPELAKNYATRIVELKDGSITSDTNPINTENVVYKKEKQKKTNLKFRTALGLSLNNLMTKKGRTILTAFAGAIGIIGIALILALSNGVNEYIDSIESETMGSYPIELEKETMDLSSMLEAGRNETEEEEHGDDKVYSTKEVEASLEVAESTTTTNNLEAFKQYLEENEDEISDSVSAIEYSYDISPIALRLNDEDVITVSPSYLSDLTSSSSNSSSFFSTSSSSEWTELVSDESLVESQYELLAGEYPDEENEIALIISEDNEVSDYILYTLGLMDYNELLDIIEKSENDEEYETSTQSFDYEEVLNKEYQVFATCEMYKKVDDAWIDKSDDQEYLTSILDNGLTVKITAVLRATDSSDISSGIGYTSKLTKYLIDKTQNSEIIQEQLSNPDVNVLTGQYFDEDMESEETADTSSDFSTEMMSGITEEQLQVMMAQMDDSTPSTYEDVLDALEYVTLEDPSKISLYPTDFDGKEVIQTFIDDYNNQVENEEDQVTYTDIIGTLTSSITSIVNMISYVLIAFVAISLIVSSIMIAIITYISVLERTKEIGVLRALGASKKGVSKIFNAETFIEGFISGLIGIGVSLLLCVPINSIVYNLTGVSNIASLPMKYGIVLVVISILLTVIAGIIPSKSASKKDPAVVLRTE